MDLRWAASFLLLSSLAAGCLDGPGAIVGAPSVDGTPARGDPETHGEAAPAAGAVALRATGDGRWTASQTVLVANDFGGASQGLLRLKTINGAVAVGPGGPDGYRALVALSATATSQDEAREALATMTVEARDDLSGRLLVIDVEVRFARHEERDVSRSGSITLTVPPGPAYSADASTVNGEVRYADLRGDTFEAQVVNGGIEVDGVRALRLSASATNDEISIEGDFDDVSAETVNGAIDATLRPTGSGRYSFHAVNGGIEVGLARGGGRGYDVSAETVNGGIDVDLAGAEPVGAQDRHHARVRTPGFSGAGIQTTVTAETVNGGIQVQDA